jgi:hypothetical protein
MSNLLIPLIQSNVVITLAAPSAVALTVSAADSGKTIMIPAATAAGTINLPVATAGLSYRFIMTATAAAIITLLPAGGTISGILLVNNGGGPPQVGGVISKAAAANIHFTATAIVGDWVQLSSDGTNWYCFGASNVAAGLA